MTRAEWKATDDPWWPVGVLLSLVVAAGPLILHVVVQHRPWWQLTWLPVVSLLSVLAASRRRLRLTDEGVEVRGLGTRLHRWSDISSVERAPDWENPNLIWLRLRGSAPTSAPEVLGVPGVRRRTARDRALDDVVAAIRQRAGLPEAGAEQPPAGLTGAA